MTLPRTALLLLWLVAPTSALAADGRVLIYLQPFPQDAARLSFALASVAAVADSGAEYPLEISLRSINASTARQQRLLASGHLPAGGYTGVSIRIRQASLKGDRGEVSLAGPDAPVAIAFTFQVGSQRTALWWLSFTYPGSVPDGYRFDPEFSAGVPPRPVAARSAFVSSPASNAILVVDKTSGQASAAIDPCGRPTGMALDQRRRRLYVVCAGSDEIAAIDVASGEVLERVPLSPGDAPREVVLSADGQTLVAVNGHSNTVTFLRASPLTPSERVAVGSGPGSIAIDPGGVRAFVFNALSSSISVVDIARRTVVATIGTDSAPLRGEFSARGDRLFVVHERSPYLTVIDPLRLTTVTRTRVRTGIDCIKADNRRDLLYIGGLRDTLIEFYNPSALLSVGAMAISGGAGYLTIDTEEDRLYVVSPDAKRVSIGSLAERRVVAEVDVGDAPGWVAVMGEK